MKKNNLYSTYQFNKYHSIGRNTHPNIAAMYFGMPMKKKKEKILSNTLKKMDISLQI